MGKQTAKAETEMVKKSEGRKNILNKTTTVH